MNITQFRRLITLPESEFLDYKEIHHQNSLDLLHDILCLANAFHDGDRFLVFGIADNRAVVGCENNTPRRNQANINNFLQTSHLNRIPKIELKQFRHRGHWVDVLIVKNRPDKPFYLLRDFQAQGRTIRNGVIYTRIGDTNTPLGSLAREDQIELMWRERLGLGVPPLERVLRYLDEENSWIKSSGDEYIYHKMFPEFTIQIKGRDDNLFQERWATRFPDQTAYRYEVDVLYLGTMLLKMSFVSCDGGRYMIPLPEIRMIGNSNRREFYLVRDSHKFKIAKIYRQYDNLIRTMDRIGIVLYDSVDEVPRRRQRARP